MIISTDGHDKTIFYAQYYQHVCMLILGVVGTILWHPRWFPKQLVIFLSTANNIVVRPSSGNL
jgi:hypothetical protein